MQPQAVPQPQPAPPQRRRFVAHQARFAFVMGSLMLLTALLPIFTFPPEGAAIGAGVMAFLSAIILGTGFHRLRRDRLFHQIHNPPHFAQVPNGGQQQQQALALQPAGHVLETGLEGVANTREQEREMEGWRRILRYVTPQIQAARNDATSLERIGREPQAQELRHALDLLSGALQTADAARIKDAQTLLAEKVTAYERTVSRALDASLRSQLIDLLYALRQWTGTPVEAMLSLQTALLPRIAYARRDQQQPLRDKSTRNHTIERAGHSL